MKYIEYLIWITGILGGIIILLGAVDLVFDVDIATVNHDVNYFHVANSLLLFAISCTLLLILKQKKGV